MRHDQASTLLSCFDEPSEPTGDFTSAIGFRRAGEHQEIEQGHWVTIHGEHGSHPVFIKDSAGHIPKRVKSANAKRFTRTEIERTLVDHYHAMGGGAEIARQAEEVHGRGGFRFAGRLPTEVKEFMAGRPELQSFFTVTNDRHKHGEGEDAMTELGSDRYFQLAELRAGSPVRLAVDFAKNHPDPELQLLAHVHTNLPRTAAGTKAAATKLKSKAGKERDAAKRAKLERRAARLDEEAAGAKPLHRLDAGGLRVGDRFSIGGDHFHVAEDDDGYRVLKHGVDVVIPVDGLQEVPHDQGSFQPAKKLGGRSGATKAGMPRKPDDDIPFSRWFDPEQGLWLSRQNAEPTTGRWATIDGRQSFVEEAAVSLSRGSDPDALELRRKKDDPTQGRWVTIRGHPVFIEGSPRPRGLFDGPAGASTGSTNSPASKVNEHKDLWGKDRPVGKHEGLFGESSLKPKPAATEPAKDAKPAARIGSANANDPKHTAEMFPASAEKPVLRHKVAYGDKSMSMVPGEDFDPRTETIVHVNAAKLHDHMLTTPSAFHAGQGGKRSQAYKDFDGWAKSGGSDAEMPAAGVDGSQPVVLSGHASLAWLRDQGAATVPVTVHKDWAGQLQKRFGEPGSAAASPANAAPTPPATAKPAKAALSFATAPLEAFALQVQALADHHDTGFGDNKVFISHAYGLAKASDPTLTPEVFKQRLVDAHRAGHLTLSRADLVAAMNAGDVEQSSTHYMNSEFHFIQAAVKDRKQTDRTSRQPAVMAGGNAKWNQAVSAKIAALEEEAASHDHAGWNDLARARRDQAEVLRDELVKRGGERWMQLPATATTETKPASDMKSGETPRDATRRVTSELLAANKTWTYRQAWAEANRRITKTMYSADAPGPEPLPPADLTKAWRDHVRHASDLELRNYELGGTGFGFAETHKAPAMMVAREERLARVQGRSTVPPATHRVRPRRPDAPGAETSTHEVVAPDGRVIGVHPGQAAAEAHVARLAVTTPARQERAVEHEVKRALSDGGHGPVQLANSRRDRGHSGYSVQTRADGDGVDVSHSFSGHGGSYDVNESWAKADQYTRALEKAGYEVRRRSDSTTLHVRGHGDAAREIARQPARTPQVSDAEMGRIKARSLNTDLRHRVTGHSPYTGPALSDARLEVASHGPRTLYRWKRNLDGMWHFSFDGEHWHTDTYQASRVATAFYAADGKAAPVPPAKVQADAEAVKSSL